MTKDRVFFWSILCFIFGIGLGTFFSIPVGTIGFLGGAVFIAIFLAFTEKIVFSLGLFFALFFMGIFLVTGEVRTYNTLPYTEGDLHGVFRIWNDPEEKSYFQKAIMRVIECESSLCPTKDILWQAPLSLEIRSGDRVSLACRFEQPKNFEPSFDYRMFLAKNEIGYICDTGEKIVILPQDRKGKLLAAFFEPKKRLERALAQAIPEPEAGLAKGLLLGGDNYLSTDLQEKFTRIGLSHMVAVSGYNITLIANGLLFIGLFLGLWRKHALWSALCGIVFFILMIGAPASALRAGLMAGIVFSALQAGRLSRPTNALLLAAAMMLFFHPLLLRYDLGFQLSFLATLAIVLVIPYMQRFLAREFFGKGIVEILIMTFAVEIFVLPVILYSFKSFSPLVIVGNLLMLLIPFAMALSFVAATLFLIYPGSHVLFAWLSYGFLSAITRSVEWLGGIANTSLVVENFGIGMVILWYSILLGIVVFSEKYYAFKRYDDQ